MKRIFGRDAFLGEQRFFLASVSLLIVASLILLRLWYLQIYRGQYYRVVSENNRVRKIDVPAPRGRIFDRNGAVMLTNTLSSDLIYIPQFVRDHEETLNLLSTLLHTPRDVFDRRYRAARSQPRFLPIILMRNLSQHEVAVIESNKIFLPGVDIAETPRRSYDDDVPAHLFGHIGEISQAALDAQNKTPAAERAADQLYFAGDLIGKHGIEKRYEKYLRGKRGYKLIQVDAFGRQAGVMQQFAYKLPEVEATPGADLIVTLDKELQKAASEAFLGKTGAVIALQPKTGEILALVSYPGFDPNAYQTGLSKEEWQALLSDPQIPLLDRSTGGEYPPGSVYKPVVAIAGLEEKVITPQTVYNCPGYYTLGGQTFRCHQKQGHGLVNLNKALMKSCDVYFYHVGVELGVDRIAHYAKLLGLGHRLGFEVNMERSGLVPTMAWKKKHTGENWAPGETPPIAIGQGYNLMTPLQMAQLYAVLAGKGKSAKPFIVKKITNKFGETVASFDTQRRPAVTGIKSETFAEVHKGLVAVVMDDAGTGKNARVPDVTVAGKTGSVQVVNSKKNHSQKDVSLRWREHAMFASYAPAEDPEIVVVVVSEHDSISGGGASAAPVAGKVLRRFFELKNQRSQPTVSVRSETKTGG